MPKRPDEPTVDEDVGFLRRWSERKTRSAEQTTSEPEPETELADPGSTSEQKATDAGFEETEGSETTAEASPEITETDLENLTYESDYTKFMGENVPEALRRRALRQLWRSDPILANVDGLCDYDDDYTDAALAVKVLKTAHKVGQGYLTDEEVEANRARGRPPEATDEASSEKTDAPSDETADNDGIDDLDDVDAESIAANAETDTTDVAHANMAEPDATDEADDNLEPDAPASRRVSES